MDEQNITPGDTPTKHLGKGDIMTLAQVAEVFQKHKSTLHDWVSNGVFPAYCQPFTYHDSDTRGWMFMRADVEKFIDERRRTHPIVKEKD